jgi:integrase
MPRTKRRLTLTQFDPGTLPPGDGRAIEYSDAERRGLRLKVTPNGARIWLFVYRRPDDGRSAKYRIGSWPEVKLGQARARAKVLAAQVTNGDDPQREKQEARRQSSSPTISALADMWLATKTREWRPATLSAAEHYVRAHIKPQLGAMDPRLVTALDVRRMLMRLRNGVRAGDGSWERAPAEVAANRLHSACRSLFFWSVENGHMDASPMPAISRPYAGERERQVFLTDDEVRRIFAALDQEPETVRDLFTLVAYCGTRNTETRTMRWSEVDLDGQLWTIPAGSHKTGDVVGGRPVPLSSPALALLRRRLQVAQAATVRSMFVFPAEDDAGRPLPQVGYVLTRLRERAGIGDATLHDFRRVMRNGMQDAGIDADVAERCLGHLPPKLARTYSKPWPVARMREALDAWATTLTGIFATTTEGIDVSSSRA